MADDNNTNSTPSSDSAQHERGELNKTRFWAIAAALMVFWGVGYLQLAYRADALAAIRSIKPGEEAAAAVHETLNRRVASLEEKNAALETQVKRSAKKLHASEARVKSLRAELEDSGNALRTAREKIRSLARKAASPAPETSSPKKARKNSTSPKGDLSAKSFEDTVWKNTCFKCFPSSKTKYVLLKSDGRFGYTKQRPLGRRESDFIFGSGNRWSLESGTLVLSWNNDFSRETFPTESWKTGVMQGSKSNVPGGVTLEALH